MCFACLAFAGAIGYKPRKDAYKLVNAMEILDNPLLPGIKPVLELLQSSPERVDSVLCRKGARSREIQEIQDLCRQRHIHFSLVDNAALDRMCRSNKGSPAHHQGVVARLAGVSAVSPDELFESALQAPLPLVIALDQVKDPGNVGTLARTMYALGAAGLLLPEHNSAYLGPAALRSSAGALSRLPVAHAVNLARALDDAEERGFTIYGSGQSQSAPTLNPYVEGLQLPAVLVLGSEEKGLRPGVAKRCSMWLNIPFARTFDSLNVAQAGGILLALAQANNTRTTVKSASSKES